MPNPSIESLFELLAEMRAPLPEPEATPFDQMPRALAGLIATNTPIKVESAQHAEMLRKLIISFRVLAFWNNLSNCDTKCLILISGCQLLSTAPIQPILLIRIRLHVPLRPKEALENSGPGHALVGAARQRRSRVVPLSWRYPAPDFSGAITWRAWRGLAGEIGGGDEGGRESPSLGSRPARPPHFGVVKVPVRRWTPSASVPLCDPTERLCI
ncbi:hypothetical protein DFH09DRAFT_1095934 [Mycena vulgaris]|nr:hypothetical protein DFH09DRAFT_1095934 [Mycena vulgaris]